MQPVNTGTMTPVAILDVDLSRPLPSLAGLGGYGSARVLVRVHGKPAGEVLVPIEDGRVDPAALSGEIVEHLGAPIARLAVRDALARGRLIDIDHLVAWIDQPLHDNGVRSPLVTVAVCTRDRTDDLARCLTALAALDYPRLDLLVVDNAPSSDATARLVTSRFPSVRYVREIRPGLDWARNRAIAEARGDILAYTDDDVIVDPGWVRAIARAFALDPTIGAITGLVLPAELDTPAQQWFEAYGGFGRGFDRRWYRPPSRGPVAAVHGGTGKFGTGANMAFRRVVFDRIGGFDPALDVGTVTSGGGDLEMFFRVLKHGQTLLYEPAAIVRHRHRREYAQLHRQIACNGLGFYSFVVRSAMTYPDERRAFARFGAWWFGAWSVKRLLRSLVRDIRIPRALVWTELVHSIRGTLRYPKARTLARAIVARYGAGRIDAEPVPDSAIAIATEAEQAVRMVEIAEPLHGVLDVGRYRRVRVFVTLHGRPIGSVDIDNEGHAVGTEQLRDAIADRLVGRLIDPYGDPELVWRRVVSTLAARLAAGPGGVAVPPRRPRPAPPARLPADVGASIVVATRDRPADLRECLASLCAQATERPLEIIVVDNHPASEITPGMIAAFPRVRLVSEARPGLSYARNAGILVASHPIIVATDDDVVCPPDWIEQLLSPFEDPAVQVVTGNVLPRELETRAQRFFEDYGGLSRGFTPRRMDAATFARSRRAVPTWEMGATANAAFRAALFADPRVGLMDEALGAGMPTGCSEDTYVFYRVLKTGGTIVYTPAAYVWHRHRDTLQAFRHQIRAYSTGHVAYQLTTWLRDGDRRGLIRMAVELPEMFARRLYHRLRGWDEYPLRLMIAEIAGTCAGPWALWRARRRVRALGRSAPEGIKPPATERLDPPRGESRERLPFRWTNVAG